MSVNMALKVLTLTVSALIVSANAVAETCDWNVDIISVRSMPPEQQSLYEDFTGLLEDKLSNDLMEIVGNADHDPDVRFTHIPETGAQQTGNNRLISAFGADNSFAEQYLTRTGYLQLYLFKRIAVADQAASLKTSDVGVSSRVYLGKHRGNNETDEFVVLAGTEDTERIADKTVQFSALLAVSLLNRNGAENTCTLDERSTEKKIYEWLDGANVAGPIRNKITNSLEARDE